MHVAGDHNKRRAKTDKSQNTIGELLYLFELVHRPSTVPYITGGLAMQLKSILLCLALVSFTVPAAAQNARLQEIVVQEHNAGRFDGAVVVLKDGKIVFSTGIGQSDKLSGTLWSPTTITRYASVTKQVTALLVMQEVAKGRVQLGAKIGDYFGEAPASVRDVTVEQLMRHTSGMREQEEKSGQLSFDFPYRAPSTPVSQQRPLEMAKAVCAGPLASPPGAVFSYGDCEYFWLGAILEKVTKIAFYDLVQRRIAIPNRFTSWGGFRPDRPVITATGYVGAGEREPEIAVWAFSSGAGLYGNLVDVARFERLLVTSALLRPDLTDLMLTGVSAYQSHAMGSWSYTVPDTSGTPVRYVERQGWVGGIRLSVISVPASDVIVAMVSNSPNTNFFGAWNPNGFVTNMITEALKQ
ncbi:MAG: beta-lactamase family protein [Ignavibacteria bacterium]|nr:beta-lactamase family protein [Ignavibacteria bacterium]